jgi:uncharacterized membrane protein YgcG
MKLSHPVRRHASRGLRGSGLRGLTVLAAFAVILSASSVSCAQAPAAAAAVAPAVPPEELEQLVGRIALYPDDLIAIVLPASTNPLQVVQADRFLEKRKADPKAPVDERWDDAIKSLLNYPEVVKAMSSDLDWTAALGEAVVADQGDVLEAIQAFRRKTQSAGNLKSDSQQVVVVEKEVIKIVPADPQVIYVPQYNPSTVVVYGGYSSWGYYPTPYPVYYYPYPPGAAFATGLVWGAAIGAAWSGNHYVAHYDHGDSGIDIDRDTDITTGDITIDRSRDRTEQRRGGSSEWKPNKQPGQVSTSVGTNRQARVGDTRAAGGATGPSGTPRATTPVSTQASPRADTRPAAPADRAAAPSTGGSAFDGYGSGRQAQLDSSRGASSRGFSGGAGGRGGGGGGRGGGGRR